MLADDYDKLYGLLEEFLEEEADVDAQISDTTRLIREADAYLATYKGEEPDDVRVFSPRKMEIIYKEEIQKKKEEKSVYEERSQSLRRRKEMLDGKISDLQDILSRRKQDFSSRMEAAREQYKASVKELDSLADKIGESSGYIEKNPFQARQDFAIIAKRLKETAEQLKKIMK